MSGSPGKDRGSAAPFLLIALFGVVYAVLARVALRAFPFSGDEYSCFLQAELFARGLLHAPAPLHPELLRVDHVVMDAWVRTKYPPGTSALLALGIQAGVPWLVTPLEAVVALVAVWRTTLAHLGSRAALLAIVVMGLSPLFAFQAASFFGHTPTTMWLALAFATTSLWMRTGSSAWPVLGGAAIGCAFLTRPGDAVYFGVALLVLRSPRVIALTALGAAPFLVGHFAYQAAQFGSPFADGYHAYEPTFRAIYGEGTGHPISLLYLVSPKEQANHLDVMRAFALEWTVPGTVLLAVIGACAIGREHPARKMRDFAVAVAVVPLAMLLVSVADPDDGARPRYLSTALLVVAFLSGPGWDAASVSLRALVGPRLTRATAVAALVGAPVEVGAFLGHRIPEVWERAGLFEAVRAAQIEQGVVVIRAEWPTRYARNGPFFDRPVLYLSASPETTVDEVAALYPGRPVYEAFEGRRWRVVRRM
jgi:4-amino-4-deoxy-L-arabinose transferase-like glycosyltransferase